MQKNAIAPVAFCAVLLTGLVFTPSRALADRWVSTPVGVPKTDNPVSADKPECSVNGVTTYSLDVYRKALSSRIQGSGATPEDQDVLTKTAQSLIDEAKRRGILRETQSHANCGTTCVNFPANVDWAISEVQFERDGSGSKWEETKIGVWGPGPGYYFFDPNLRVDLARVGNQDYRVVCMGFRRRLCS